MSSQKEFYQARAAEARRDAEAATLDNVRDRCLRAEAAWSGMADRAARTDRMRIKAEAEKAARASELAK
ncbi:MAG TPA: hypothetical protein VJ859_13810 [Allosphingosinicella sp.]|nr:hypothetical protein [Allosphingosinicella sp.]